ncbi:MAG TPA: DHA2 family efflux MFS transporter permease subunit [Trebonia sp.]|jgi:EmrB/QacA subfamily drug resistance transporter|nr:DHA2 family efflux MFS transporter permease subunit [Trebonia sp.]
MEARTDRRWWILAVLCLSVLLVVVDNTIVNVALPTISRDLHASTSDLQWVVDGYTLSFAGLLLLGGNLGDRLGRRRFLQLGLLLFGLFSVGAALSQNTGELVAARALMGIGAAMVYPATLAILNTVFTAARERAIAIGVWSAVSGLAVAIGPVAGGALLRHFSWSSVFYVSVPLVVVAVIAGRFLLPESRDRNAGRFDPLGALLSAAGIALLTWSIIEAPDHGWGSAATVGGIGGALALLAVFAWWQVRRPDPMLDVRLFRNPRFSAASGAIALSFFGLFGFIFMITQYFQVVRGYDPLGAGIATLPFAFVTAGFSPVAMLLMRRFGTKLVVAGGLAVMGAGFLVAAATAVNEPYWHTVIISMTLMAAGLGLTTGPATEAIMGALPAGKAGAGSAVNDTTREVGGTLGVAIVGSVLNSAYGSHVFSSLTALGASASAAHLAGQSVIAGMNVAGRFPAPLRDAAASAVRTAFVTGLHRGSLVAAGTSLAAALVALLFVPARPAPATDPALARTEAADSSTRIAPSAV